MSQPPPITMTRMVVPYGLWALHFLSLYSLQGLACARQLWRTSTGGVEIMTWVRWALTAAILAAIAWQAMRAWRIRRTLLASPDAGRTEHSRRHFMVNLCLLGAAISALGVVFTASPLAMLQTCA